MTHYSIGLYLLAILLLADVGVSQLRRSSKSSGSVASGASSGSSSSSASQIVDFDCPEEFGYYPHPDDCTQYYVCVFGGALLESCTGGLMYSHELQTCDWPRNVGCGEAVSAVSTVKAAEPRPRPSIQLRPQQQPLQQQQQQYVQQRPLQRDEAIPKHHLYAEEDLGPAEEVESDRQQRVYRGQPATLGQVARDRDGLSRHSNSLQVSPANGREKLSVISFGTQQQYRTDSETDGTPSNGLAVSKHRHKRQIQFSFPGDTRMLHPSASSRSRSWTAGSPHFPFSQQPPPPPSHLSPPPWSSTSFTQHFQHSSENGQGFNARFNIVPNRPAPSIPHFSKPVRFPVQDNDDFVPMFGQGIRLPKPSPGILITPTSNEHNQNIKPSNVFKEFVPSEKQPDNYVFFNLESSPHVYNGVNRTIPTINNNFNHNISHYSSAHSTVLGNNTYRGNTFNSNQNNFSPTRNPPTGNSLQTVQNFRDNTSYRPNFDSTENSLENTEKSNPNLIASASYSEETQVSPPSNSEESNWNEDKPDYTYEPLGFDEDRSNSNYDEATKSSPYSSNADNTEEDSTTHSYEDKEGEDTTEHSEESQEESRYVDQNDHESNDFNETSVESHISDFPSPPKEFFEKPDLNNKHYYNPFSNPEFDYDKYIDELSDHKINQDKKETVHQDKETYEINQQRLSLNRHRTKPRKEKNHHSEQIYNIDSESNEKLSKVHPGLVRGIQYQPLPEAAPRILRNRVRAKPQDNRSGYQKHPTINQQKRVSHTGNSKINKMPFKNVQYSRSKSGSKRNRHSPVHLINTDDDNDQNDRGGSTIPSNRLSGSYNKPNKNILTSLSDHESQKKFKENENINTDSEYLSPNGQPSLYSVHKQNSESDLPHQEQTKSTEKDAYDDEDYYDSNEDAEYYDDYSLENTPSLLNKQIKPPKAPKRITNIENMSFDKPDADEDYDDVSAEETDDEDKTSNKDSHIQAHVADCNKKYKNHKCNVDDSEENDYKEGKPENSEEYSADEDEEEDEDTENNNNRSNQYEVVEDAAESQHHMRKTAMNNKQMANLFPNNYSKNGSLNMSNKSNMNVPSINQLNGFNLNLSTNNKANNKSFQIPFSLSGKNVSNTFSKDILLKALSADQGLSSRSKNTLSNNSLNSLHRFITFPKIINKPNKTVTYLNNNKSVVNSDLVNKSNRSSQMTMDNTKLHFSSTSPLNPKPLKYLKQRPVTKPTDVTAAGDFETREPMTQLNMDSHLTNSVTAAGRQSIQPASYVEPTTTQRVTSRGYNTTQHQQYTPSPYDPYYNIYEDDTDLYKDIDYSQYSGQQYQAQPAYKEKQSQVPQQQVQSTPSRKPSVQYSPPPPPPPQQSYNAVQQDVYSQAVSAQDYNDNYNLQDEDIDYKQSDIDLKGNRSRTTQPPKTPELETEKTKENNQTAPRNRQITLTAAFSFDDKKTPVTSSKRFEENIRQRTSVNSFRVEEPPSTGPLRERHNMILSYLRQETPVLSGKDRPTSDEQERPSKVKHNEDIKQASQKEVLSKNNSNLSADHSDTNQNAYRSSPKTFLDSDEPKLRTSRPFRIIVPSTTENVDTDQVTFRPRNTPRRGNRLQNYTFEAITLSSQGTIKPYKLPLLTRESISSQTSTPQPVRSQSETTQDYKISQANSRDVQTSRQNQREGENLEKPAVFNQPQDFDDEIIKYIPIMSRRTPLKTTQQETTQVEKSTVVNQRQNSRHVTGDNSPQNQDIPAFEESSPTDTTLLQKNKENQRSKFTATTLNEEESVFKFIPINAVRSRISSNPNNNKNMFLRDSQSDNNNKDTKENISIDKEPEIFSQDKQEYQQVVQEKPSDQKVDKFNYRDSFLEENTKKLNNDAQSPSRTRYRFSQENETPIKRPIYSLSIDNESGKYKGQINGVVLATLETIVDSDEVNKNNKAPSIRLTASQQETSNDHITTSLVQTEAEKETISYSSENNDNDQARIRNRGRTFATATDSRRDEYNKPLAHTTTTASTDVSDNDPETSPVRLRSRTRSKQSWVEPSNTYSTTESPAARNYTSDKLQQEKQETSFYRSNNEFTVAQSTSESELKADVNNYQGRRQLSSRNRLRPVTYQLETDLKNEKGVGFDSEEEIFSIKNNKVTTESDLKENDEFAPRGIQTWNLAADAYEFEDTESENIEPDSDQKTYERLENTRKIHTKKRIRYTLQPLKTTQSPESYMSRGRTVTLKPIFKEFPSTTEDRLSSTPLVDDFNGKINADAESLKNVNNLRDWSLPRNRGVSDDRSSNQRENSYHSRGRDSTQIKSRYNTFIKSSTSSPTTVNPYTLVKAEPVLKETFTNSRSNSQEFIISKALSPDNARNESIEIRPNNATQTYSPIALEINSYFTDSSTPSTTTYVPVVDTKTSTTPSPTTTFEKIRDKFRLGSFPKPTPSSHGLSRKPSVEDSTPPPLPSDKCSQELDNESECNDKPVRVRPISISSDSQSTPGLTRGGGRTRGSATYTVSPNEAESSPTPNRGTPSSIGRNRPTLKPSTSIVSKASEFIDIYRYPPSRPEPIYPTPQVDKTAAKCRKDVCLLPDCSCGGKEIPGELTPEQTPQIVLLTFDDSVNDLNKGLYSDLFEKGRTNPNGCPISATFYVSHEWTDYSQVQNLYASGHEMASHSVSHSFGEQFSVKKWTKEIAGQREILSAYGGVRQEDIRGMRAPFLSIGGNKMFKMLYDSNFTYDSSMPVYENKPPSWPYTLDYKIFHDCMIPPCPTRSYPGVWEVPMVMWQDLNGGRCSMGDACSNPPTSDGVYKMLIKNFERHFTSNRAPFGLFYHAAWFTQPHHKEGFIAFLDAITKMPEVWVITNWQAIQWVRDPTPISRLNNFAPFQCNYPERPRRCNNPKVCNLWHKSGVRYMRTCQPCPEIYPWTGKSGVRNSRVDNEIITE